MKVSTNSGKIFLATMSSCGQSQEMLKLTDDPMSDTDKKTITEYILNHYGYKI